MGNNSGSSDWRERAVIAALLTACLVLAILQYRWTGELSRAESQRLYTTASGRLQQLARAFDTELRQSISELVPSGEEVRTLGPQRANEERLRAASQRLERPLFLRIAAAVPDASRKLQFFDADLTTQKVVPAEWPESASWQALRRTLQSVADGEPPRGRMVDPATALIEVPVFGAEAEQEWILFELDTAYAAQTWLPELMKTYINAEGDENFRATVTWNSGSTKPVYGTQPASKTADAEAMLFPIRFLGGGGPRGGRRGGGGSGADDGRWRISLSHPQGSVPAAVQAARWRNLAIALVPLILIAFAGVALVRHTRQARRLAEAQYQFFAGISHELRTPLTVIQGAGHNLLSGIVKDETQRESYAQAIVKQSTQLTEMVDQLLTYGAERQAPAKTDTGKTSLDIAVSEAIEIAAIELEQSLRAVDVDMPPDLPEVRGDQATLRRVLGNLILNAIRHGGGEVKVTAVRVGAMVEVRVADSGDGISPEELSQVFDPFFRGKRARTGRTRGTGLGLSLVKEIVERLGGSVSVESQVGKGTVFSVRLPAVVS